MILRVLIAAVLLVPAASWAQQIVRVPADQSSLQDAVAAVPDGGVIEMAAGTYTAPPSGFTIYNTAKRFTVRAVAGASVVLSGGGSHDIIRFGNPTVAAGRPVTFQGLTFSNGLSTTDFI